MYINCNTKLRCSKCESENVEIVKNQHNPNIKITRCCNCGHEKREEIEKTNVSKIQYDYTNIDIELF